MSLLYKDTPVGFHRVLDGPLDDHEVFTSNEDLLDYCKNGTAYHGQRVLLTYDGLYDQPCTIKRGRSTNRNTLIPIVELPSGIELITYENNDEIYGLVCYFNDGKIYTDTKDILVKFDDMYYFAMLPQVSLLANKNTDIEYLFQVKGKPDEIIIGGNPLDNPEGEIIRNIRENLVPRNILKVWVRCTEYYKAMGV